MQPGTPSSFVGHIPACKQPGYEMVMIIHIAPLVDLTLLDESATPTQLLALSQEAEQFQVASVCVYPAHLTLLRADSFVKTTVLNFPTGNETHSSVLKALKQIIHNHAAQEIDYVFPYAEYLNGNQNTALSKCKEIIQLCKSNGLKVKVILETEVYTRTDVLYELCLSVIELGCDFLKTSTGKKPVGATLEAAETLLRAIKSSNRSCGLKISGGIQTPAQAQPYIKLAESIMKKPVNSLWFRIGSSKIFKKP